MIDPTIALGIKPTDPATQFNPLANLAQVAQTGNALLSLRTGQQQLAARQAIGQAYQAAANPDGSVDYGKLQNIIQQNPAASWMAPQIMQGIQEQQKRAFELQKAGQDQATSRAGIFGSALAPLLAKGNAIGTSDVTGVLARLHAAGIPIDGAVQQVIQTMPTEGGAPLRQWALQNFGAGLPSGDQVSTFLPKVATQDLGGQVSTYDQNAVTNPNAANLTFNKTLSPDSQVKQVTGPLNARGGSTVLPQAAYAASAGMGGLVPGGTGGGPSAFGTGRPAGLPPALLNPNASGGTSGGQPAAPAPPAATGTAPGFNDMLTSLSGSGSAPSQGAQGPAGQPAAPSTALGQPVPTSGAPMTTGLGPGQQAGLDTAGKASADQWANLQAQVGGTAAGGGSAGRIYMLQHAQTLLSQLGSTGTGPSSPQTQAAASYLQSIPGIGSYIPAINPQNIANYDEANKALTAYASARAGAHGGTTDSQLATTLSSNASTHISNLAAQDVVKANIGLERMDQAQAASFQAATDPTTGQPYTPDQFSNFSANWNRTQDPRAYVADQLAPGQVKSLVASMTPADQAKFQSTYSTGVQNGWITPPSWAAPGGAAAASVPSDGSAPSTASPAAAAAPSTADLAVNP